MEKEDFVLKNQQREVLGFSTQEGLQTFTNKESLDLPTRRRDLDDKGNIRWLLRNVGIYNDVPEKYIEGLRRLLKDAEI